MQMTSIEQQKKNNIIRYLFIFVVLIGFSFSTLDEKNINLNSDRDIIFEKIFLTDLYILNNPKDIFLVIYMINGDKTESLENFNETFTYKLIENIYVKFKDSNYENIPIIEIDKILNIIIDKISEIFEKNIYNNNFLNEAIIILTGIYSNYNNDNRNLKNFNKKIIPIANNIIKNHKYRYNDTKNFREYIIKFLDLTKNKNFFFNLEKNLELKKHFFNIINEYISFLKNDKKYYDNAEMIYKFFNKLVLENIVNDFSCKRDYFELLDIILKSFLKDFLNNSIKYNQFDTIKNFINMIFENPIILENFRDKEILIKIINIIAKIEFEKIKKEDNGICLYIIELYTKHIVTFSKEKNSKLIGIFEENIEKLIFLINSYKLNSQNSVYNIETYKSINKYLYNLNINFKKDKFNNLDFIKIKSIQNTFYDHITKIVLFELKKIDFDVREIHNNYIVRDFLSKSPVELEKYNIKNEIINKPIKILQLFYKKSEDQELSENILSITDKNILEFVFLYEFIDINEVENRKLVLKFLEIYSNKFLKSVNNFTDFELFIILNIYIKNLPKKLEMDEFFKKIFLEKVYKLTFKTEVQEFIDNKYKKGFKNNFLEKVNKLPFKTEVQEFIGNKDKKEFKKLFIVKFITAIKESKLKILNNLEKILNKEDFKDFMINFIDNFKKLDDFYNIEKNNNQGFLKTVYIDFKGIFQYKIEKKMSEENEKKTEKILYWSENEIRKEIIAYLNCNILFTDDLKKKNRVKPTDFLASLFSP